MTSRHSNTTHTTRTKRPCEGACVRNPEKASRAVVILSNLACTYYASALYVVQHLNCTALPTFLLPEHGAFCPLLALLVRNAFDMQDIGLGLMHRRGMLFVEEQIDVFETLALGLGIEEVHHR